MSRNWGIPRLPSVIEERDHAPIVIIWLIAAFSGGFMGFMLGLTIGMGLR